VKGVIAFESYYVIAAEFQHLSFRPFDACISEVVQVVGRLQYPVLVVVGVSVLTIS
jgi:hypothetical protein